MSYQSVFKRYEIKYCITYAQKETILKAMGPYLRLDGYGRTVIRNLYYDTDTFRLARRSREKPVYKEKLRIRSYRTVQPDEPVFVELKKKYNSVVYKRRVALPENTAMRWISDGIYPPERTQICDEIEYFRQYYGGLRPAVFLSYEREAYYDPSGSDFRVTFDENILARRTALSLGSEPGGVPLMDAGNTLMEIKTSAGIPLWMTDALTCMRIFKTSFSKYGNAYEQLIYTDKGDVQNVFRKSQE